MEVSATDKGTPALSNTTIASITVTDINDNNPEFDKKTLIGQILENEPVASSVCTVVASDKDIGKNAQITYSLNANDAFSIDPATGVVSFLLIFPYIYIQARGKITFSGRGGRDNIHSKHQNYYNMYYSSISSLVSSSCLGAWPPPRVPSWPGACVSFYVLYFIHLYFILYFIYSSYEYIVDH